MMIIVFLGIKGTHGLRATAEEEIKGLDITEHGLLNSYADFVPTESFVAVTGEVPVAEAVEVKRMPTFDTQSPKFTKIEIIFKEEKLYVLKEAMNKLGITGMTVSQTNMSS